MRRLTFSKPPSECAACATGTPTWRAAAMAASALERLCLPVSDQRTVPDGSPLKMTSKLPSSCSVMVQLTLSARPKFSCSLQQPRNHALQSRLVAVDDEPAYAGHGANQMVELGLDRAQIGEDVGVIVFEVVEDGGLGVVVDELAALVEEGRVVLVGLDDEEGRVGALAVALARQARRDAEVHRHAADQEAGRIAGVLQYPGQHGRGGGLAVRAGHGQHPAVLQDVLAHPLRAGGERQVAVH